MLLESMLTALCMNMLMMGAGRGSLVAMVDVQVEGCHGHCGHCHQNQLWFEPENVDLGDKSSLTLTKEYCHSFYLRFFSVLVGE